LATKRKDGGSKKKTRGRGRKKRNQGLLREQSNDTGTKYPPGALPRSGRRKLQRKPGHGYPEGKPLVDRRSKPTGTGRGGKSTTTSPRSLSTETRGWKLKTKTTKGGGQILQNKKDLPVLERKSKNSLIWGKQIRTPKKKIGNKSKWGSYGKNETGKKSVKYQKGKCDKIRHPGT